MRKSTIKVAVSETPTCTQSNLAHRPCWSRLVAPSAVLLTFLVLPGVVRAQFNYAITTNLTITITGYTGPGGTVIVPDEINGLPVTSIASDSIAQNGYITNIMISSSVTNIADSAFIGNFNLLTINVDVNNSHYSGADGVLFDKSQSTLIQYPIGRSGPYAIPDGVTNIGNNAFRNCYTLNGITIPNSVIAIGDYVFLQCYGLLTVTIPDSVTDIGVWAFQSCWGLTNVTLGSSVTSIEPGAFSDCKVLSSVSFPKSVRSIGDSAFTGCSLVNVTIPSTLTYLGSQSFRDCGSLTNAIVGSRRLSDGTFMGCTSLISVTLQEGLVEIGTNAFNNCSSLTGVTIPTSVTTIGDLAFVGCHSLVSAMVGDNVTSLGDAAFYGCISLTNVTIGNGVTKIGTSEFAYCSSLTSVTIGKNVAHLGQYAFGYCGNLAAVFFQGNAPAVDCCFTPCCVFQGADHSIIYYLSGTQGWGPAFADRPTLPLHLPYPLFLSFGVQTDQFGFTASWATNLTVVVEAVTNLTNPVWSPLATNALTTGWFYFADPQWTNYPSRFYRIRSP